MRLSNLARKESTIGQMINLLSVNAQPFTEFPYFLNTMWSSFLSMGVCLFLLWDQLRLASLGGLIIMILLIPITSISANKIKKLKLKRLNYQDDRIKILNEMLNGIKVIKFYAWELPFKNLIDKIRKVELRILKWITYISFTTGLTLSFTPFLVINRNIL